MPGSRRLRRGSSTHASYAVTRPRARLPLAEARRMRACPIPGLEVVVQYWLYSLVDDWHSTPRSVSVPGAGTVRLPGINQHHEGDWEAVTVGMSADRPAVRRLERPLRRRVASVRGRDPRRRPRRLAHAPRVLGGAGLARQPAGARDRTPALVEVRPAHGDVRAPARRERDRPGRGGGARQPSRRRARNSRPRGQRHSAGVPA